MNKDIAIKVENLSKVYKLYSAPIDRMKEALHPFKKNYHKEFYALNNVSFEIKRGECVGILGKNGAGKSTILKIITGVLNPTSGKVIVNGKISALLELGAGFNPEYTGMENIYFQGNLMGFEREEMDAKVQAILDFADIGAFIDQPVKNYSSGMFARLAFAVAISVEPDILIVDEALSVGDMFFQAKSMTHMKKLIESDKTTVLFVSHDIASIRSMCSKAVLLENGSVKMFGSADEVTNEYFASKYSTEKSSSTDSHLMIVKNDSDAEKYNYPDDEFLKTSSFQRIGNGGARYSNVVILDEEGHITQDVKFGQTITIRCFIDVFVDIHNLVFGVHIRDRNGFGLLYDDTMLQNTDVFYVKKGNQYMIDWTFKVLLQPTQFSITVVASVPIDMEVGHVEMFDYVPIASQFRVSALGQYVCSAIHLDSQFEIKQVDSFLM